MSRLRKLQTVYRKELTEILRDRRTLMAMILIPVVLYPLLILGFLWAAQLDEARLHAQQFTIEVDAAATADMLSGIIRQVQDLQESKDRKVGKGPSTTSSSAARVAAPDQELHEEAGRASFDVRVGHTPDDELGDVVQARVVLKELEGLKELIPRMSVEIIYNEVNIRSRTAAQELNNIMTDLSQIVARRSVRDIVDRVFPELPANYDVALILNPIEINSRSVATERQRGGWALGQILPLILVLMTITGAIYPAIDLTAGERERGTLETLMALPVAPLDLIVGKFLVVATIGLATAFLNLASVGATMHFGGLLNAITSEMPVQFPLGVLPVILVCMVPFALLFGAVLVAVCSFARTFREAQNYVMPVIIGAMIPSIAATLPSVRLEGIMLVVPVGNMVMLARELFQQTCGWPAVLIVLLSTSLYAVAAVGVAARLFGQEAVLFVDTGSYKTLFYRRLFKETAIPTVAQALFLVAILFPLSFYAQGLIFGASAEQFVPKLKLVAILQFGGLFLLLPMLLCIYLKINLASTFRWRKPAGMAILAAVLLGVSTFAVSQQFMELQSRLMPPSRSLVEFERQLETELGASPLWLLLLLLACVPAITEEMLFRGFLLSGLRSTLHKWPAILAGGIIFGVFHYQVERMPLTALLAMVLGYLCWQSRSIWPGIIVHAMHNSWPFLLYEYPALARRMGMANSPEGPTGPAPLVFISAACLFLLGLLITWTLRSSEVQEEKGNFPPCTGMTQS